MNCLHKQSSSPITYPESLGGQSEGVQRYAYGGVLRQPSVGVDQKPGMAVVNLVWDSTKSWVHKCPLEPAFMGTDWDLEAIGTIQDQKRGPVLG